MVIGGEWLANGDTCSIPSHIVTNKENRDRLLLKANRDENFVKRFGFFAEIDPEKWV